MDKDTMMKNDGAQLLQGYTPSEMEAFLKGALYGARNHKEINRRPKEWYERHNARKAVGEGKSEAVAEFFKEATGLGRAVDNLKNLKTYEEVRDEVLEKLMHGLCSNASKRREFMELLAQME